MDYKVVLWTDQYGAETHVFDSGKLTCVFNINERRFGAGIK